MRICHWNLRLHSCFRVYSYLFWGGGKAIDTMIYGALIVLISVFQPEGLVGLFSKLKTKE
jgi:ABC-type branched-subunit amino acid transport system permease subunit